jgi:hypothetical protein
MHLKGRTSSDGERSGSGQFPAATLANRAPCSKTRRLRGAVPARVEPEPALRSTQAKGAPPSPAGRRGLGQSLLERRGRDQIRLEVSPPSSSKRFAKMGLVKLGSSSLTER